MRRSFCVFVDQRKQMTDGTARGTMKEYVRVVQHTYEDSAEVAEVHQGSALSPCFFAVLIDGMADEARQATL